MSVPAPKRRNRPVAPALCILVAGLIASAFAGCGGSTDAQKGVSRSDASSGARTADSSPPVPEIATSVYAKRVVRRYYAGISDADFSRAWSQLSPGVRTAQGGFAPWKNGYDLTVETNVTRLVPLAESSSRVVLDVGIRSVDVDECADTVRQRFAGTWTVQRIDGKWKGTRLKLHRVAGREPVRDSADCFDDTSPPPNETTPEPPSDYAAPPDSSPPSPDFCDTHNCIPNYPNGNGYTVPCNDGSYSQSGGIQGACSHHGGVAEP